MSNLRRYERPIEAVSTAAHIAHEDAIAFSQAGDALAASPLSPGSRKLLLALLRTGSTRIFEGGGLGIEYGSLLKTATRPDEIGDHILEAAAHLTEHKVDVLLVPGVSGYPVGAMYSLAAGIPAILLKKQKLNDAGRQQADFPPGSFVIPSYTGEGEMVMSADLDAVCDIVASIVAPQFHEQRNQATVHLSIRCAGADDIIDKAVMALAISECAPLVGRPALDLAIQRHRRLTGDNRTITTRIDVVAWVTPLIKSYHQPQALLKRKIGIEPFAGISVTSVHVDPCAIGIEGAGLFAFDSRNE
jgi:hypothetical protein